MTDPISGAAWSLGGRAATAGAKEVTLEWRVARNVTASAKRRGVNVNQKQLKLALYMPDVLSALQNLQEPASHVRARLDEIECDGVRGGSGFLLPLLREAVARQMSAAESQAFLYREVAAPVARIAALLDSAGSEAPALSPPLFQDSQRIADIVGQQTIARLIRSVAPATSRAHTLEDWLSSRPSWLAESELVDAWLGELALDSDLGDLGRSWLHRALGGGATPRPYLKVRIVTSRRDDEGLAALSDVRGHPLVESVLSEHDLAARRKFLSEWTPSSDLQRSLKANINAQQLLEARDLDGAIASGREAFEVNGYAGAGVIAAQALIQRSMVPGRQSQTSDLASARTLALRIRDARRITGTVAARSIRIAIQASMLLGDFGEVRSLFTAVPAGDAAPEEAAHPDVQEAAISALAQLGDISEALAKVSEQTSRETVLQLKAREAELGGDDDLANQLWSEAVHAVDDWSEKATICFLLASRGVIHPFVDDLRPHNEEIAEEIDVIAKLNRQLPGSEPRAAKEALDNPRVARALAQFYSESNRERDSLRLAEQMARRWGDPDEWLRAARFHLRNGSYLDAIDRARTAFSVGGEAWGNRASALRLQIVAMQELRRWEDIVAVGQTLLELDPEADDAGWSMVFAHHHSADDEQAFSVWRSLPACRVPRTVSQASLWLHLFQRFGTEMAPLSSALALIKLFPQDEQVRRLAVGAVLFAPISTSDVGVQVTDLADEYHADFPDQPELFWTLTLESEDPDEIIAALDRAAGDRPDMGEIEQGVANGTFPIGLLAKWAKRDYTDVLVRRRFAPRFAGTAENQELNHDIVALAIESGAAIDASAAVTVAMLPEETGEAVAKIPARLLATYGQLRDVHDSAAQLKKSRGEFFASTNDRGPRFHQLSPDEEAEQARIFDNVQTRIRQAERSDPRSLTVPKPGLDTIFGPWTEAMSRAAEAGVPLWCDDAATRHIATSLGVPAFGTPELVEYSRDHGLLSASTADAIDAALVHAHLVGVRFRSTSWGLALALDSHRPAGLAQALAFGGATNVAEKLQLVFEAIRHSVDDPDALSGWGEVAAKYLADMTTTDDEAVNNLAIFLRAVLAAAWLAPHQLAFVARGFREQAADRWYPALRKALAEHWDAIRRIVTQDVGAAFVLGQASALSANERQIALEIILRDGG
ncbi:lipopolysaccharide assembly protein LapB [Microbacterium sp. cx-59]|uniref:tetratricopeptide repeat protein n=1 Tax=Microbacterium sp. cx-59 TaxID=2891207 RepID=UPI001E3E43A7|nr:hypothetical protein [Microbacterium sp. cx-59]MCC4908883.1 hypothetical protein [Microbacterium sp. cx-59]